jgi:lysophospholipase L1-like esterase
MYMTEIENAVELLNGDALNIAYIPTREYMFGTAAELEDLVHPNAVGHKELSNAFLSGLK